MTVETKVLTMDCPAADRDATLESICNDLGAQRWRLNNMGEKEPYKGTGGVPMLRIQLVFIRNKTDLLLEG